MNNIIIVEDELIAAEYLKALLQNNGFNVMKIIKTGKEAISEIPKLKPDLVLMDIMLKDNISGSEVALQLKHKAPNIAIVFLTAYAESEMLDYAIESNTYGYMMKPYEEQRILTSLKIIFSRIEKDKNNTSNIHTQFIQISKDLLFDLEEKRLLHNQQEVVLGVKSLAILYTLCKHPNITVSTEELCMNIWGEIKDTAMLRTQISRLKKSLDRDIIKNVKGLGYRIICQTC